MKLVGIAGLMAMLVFALPAAAGRDQTKLEHQVRSYLETSGRYHQLFGAPDDARLGTLTCGRAGRADDLMCAIPIGERGGGRFFVSRAPAGDFDFRACRYDTRGYSYVGWDESDYEADPCFDDITRR
jgi:hypothetical protein